MAPPEVKTRNAIKGHNLDELSLEDIQHYVTSLSQYHKIFLHRTLAHWRNSTVDNVTKGLRKGWSTWCNYLHMMYRAQSKMNKKQSAEELKEYAHAALLTPCHHRSPLDISRIVAYFRHSKLLPKKLTARAMLTLAKESALWEAPPNKPMFFQGQRGDGAGPGAPSAWWQWGFYVLVSGKINLYSFSDKGQEAAALSRFVMAAPPRTKAGSSREGAVTASGSVASNSGGGGGSSSSSAAGTRQGAHARAVSEWMADDEADDGSYQGHQGGMSPEPTTPGGSRKRHSHFGGQQPSSGGRNRDSFVHGSGAPSLTKGGIPLMMQLPSSPVHLKRLSVAPPARRASMAQAASLAGMKGYDTLDNPTVPVESSANAPAGGDASGAAAAATGRNVSTAGSSAFDPSTPVSPLTFEPNSPSGTGKNLGIGEFASLFQQQQQQSRTPGSARGNEPPSPKSGGGRGRSGSRGGGGGMREPASPGSARRRSTSRGSLEPSSPSMRRTSESPNRRPSRRASSVDKESGSGGGAGQSSGAASPKSPADRRSSSVTPTSGGSGGGGGGQPTSASRRGTTVSPSGAPGGGGAMLKKKQSFKADMRARRSTIKLNGSGLQAAGGKRGSSAHGGNGNGNDEMAQVPEGQSPAELAAAAAAEKAAQGPVDDFPGVDFLTSGVLGDLIFSTSNPGHCLGEIALLDKSNPVRTAAGVVAEPSMVLVVGPSCFARTFERDLGQDLDVRGKMAFLERPQGLFKNWRQAQLSQLAYVLHPETYLNRDVIAVQGTSVDRYWFVKEGVLKVVMQLKGASGGGDSDANPSAAAAGGGSSGTGTAPGSGAAALKRAGLVSKAAAAAASGKVLGARPNFFDVEVGRIGVGSVIDDIALVEGNSKHSATFVADGVVELLSIKVADFERYFSNGTGPARATGRDVRAIGESRRELRFAKVQAAKASYVNALKVAAQTPATPAADNNNSGSSSSSSSVGVISSSGGGGGGDGDGSSSDAPLLGSRFRTPAYDVAWQLAGKAQGRLPNVDHRNKNISSSNGAGSVKPGGAPAGSLAASKALSDNSILKFTRVKGTGAASTEHLPTGSAFSLLQVINELPRV